MLQNEIRDYIARAPRRWRFDGSRMINNTAARYAWLSQIASGTLDDRINRRAGIVDVWKPWGTDPVRKAINRNYRKGLTS